ncbi:MAG: LysM peptidoglycan-binding domain-containing protein [Anaerolineaceae bacterium]|nr:LysM peptidoglycan-binding domain-containing protein [Anaerolineaceae bacterium]
MEKAKLYTDYLYLSAISSIMPTVECQFNPTELGISRSTKWEGNPVPERDFPRTEFKGGNAATYNLSLFFDAYATDDYKTTKPSRRDIRKDINNLMAMGLRTYGYSVPLPYAYLGEPPSVIFVWGGIKLFRAVLTSINVKYTMFDSNGVPTRATAECTFMEQSHPLDFLPPQNPTSRTEPRHTVRVTQGDRLDLIANNFYGDCRMWRAIADANDLDDPFNLTPGQLLSMPNLD